MAVRISQKLLKALEEASDKGWFYYSDLQEALGSKDEAFYTLIEGYSMGFFNIKGEDSFEISIVGLQILDSWREAGRPAVDPWIDSRVYTMLRTVDLSTSIPDAWYNILAERGLVSGDSLSDAGTRILSILPGTERGLIITKPMARELVKIPDGPAPRDEYGRFQPVFEAMGLIVGTVPLNQYYSLTSAGRLIKKAIARINLDSPWPSIINAKIIEILEKAEKGADLTPEETTYAGTIGYLKPNGGLDYPGRLVLKAYRSLGLARRIAPLALSSVEERLLKIIVDLWRTKNKDKPNLLLTKDRILDAYSGVWGTTDGLDLGLDLLHLESLGLIEESSEDGKQVYKPTATGEMLAELPGIGKGTPTTAVKSITAPLSYASPSIDWINDGLSHDIIGTNGPTKRGLMLAMASGTPRKPLVTRIEAVILQSIPDSKSMPRETLLEKASRYSRDPWKPLNRLETRGLIDTMPDNRVRLTEAGKLLKTVLVAVPPGIAVPVNPVMVRVLAALHEYGKDDIAEIVNRTGLTLEAVRDSLILARSARLIGKGGGLTAAGRALLELARVMTQGETGIE